MPPDLIIIAGCIAFEPDLGDAEAAMARREGLQDVHLVDSGHRCTEHPALRRYLVEVHGEADPYRASEWMDRVEVALNAQFPTHRCVG